MATIKQRPGRTDGRSTRHVHYRQPKQDRAMCGAIGGVSENVRRDEVTCPKCLAGLRRLDREAPAPDLRALVLTLVGEGGSAWHHLDTVYSADLRAVRVAVGLPAYDDGDVRDWELADSRRKRTTLPGWK